MKRLERLVAIAIWLSARRRARASDIARHFSVTERTVYRDVKALQEGGFPLEGSAGDGYRLTQETFLRPLSLSTPEAEALSLAAELFRPTVDAPLREALGRATAKLEGALDRATRRRLRELRGRLAIPEMARRPLGPVAGVLESMRTCTVARIDYLDLAGRRTERDIEPLGIVFLGDAWLLIAYCLLRNDARAFRVERIASFRATATAFAPRQGMSFGEIIDREGRRRPAGAADAAMERASNGRASNGNAPAS